MTGPGAFSVNGRFLSQSLTGVQRYARHVVGEMDRLLASAGEVARLVAPPGTPDPCLANMPLTTAGPGQGHLWEQAVLPLTAGGRLLNLCNTAPVVLRDQIVCLHDANVFTAPQSYGAAFRQLYRRLQPLIARRALRVATVSHASARSIARHMGLDPAAIAVLPNGHEHALDWRPENATAAPASRAGLAERPFVLAIGSRAQHKNMQLLATIAPTLAARGVDIVVAGGEGRVFSADGALPPAGLFHLGRVSDDDLAWLMDRALCLAFPSLTEGFGLPIVEAMARGCPVISSDRASMPEVSGNAGLLAAPDDPEAWLQGIDRIAGSATLREELAGLGREQARLFRWSDSAAGYLDLLRQPSGRLSSRPSATPSPEPAIAVVVATMGRPEIVSRTIRHLLDRQCLQPASIIVSCATEADAGNLITESRIRVVTGPAGLPKQRNRGLAAVPADTELVVFFDDDFVASDTWLASVAQVFRDEASLAGLTGLVLADGIKGPGIGFDEAVRIVDAGKAPATIAWTEPYSPYGCNMAFRASAIRSMRFDERLVLYGWLEDRDFGARVRREGWRLARTSEAYGVHMGVKGGRVRGERLGYSQVVNPLYMRRKGTMTLAQVADHVFRNMASNLARSANPEPYVDRRGRLRGNLWALRDILRGQVEPERAALILTATRRTDDRDPSS